MSETTAVPSGNRLFVPGRVIEVPPDQFRAFEDALPPLMAGRYNFDDWPHREPLSTIWQTELRAQNLLGSLGPVFLTVFDKPIEELTRPKTPHREFIRSKPSVRAIAKELKEGDPSVSCFGFAVTSCLRTIKRTVKSSFESEVWYVPVKGRHWRETGWLINRFFTRPRSVETATFAPPKPQVQFSERRFVRIDTDRK